jgi:hypothetical protein
MMNEHKQSEAIMEYTRFDIPASVSVLIDKAFEIELIDGSDLIALTINHGSNWNKIAEEILQYAYSNKHVNSDHNIITPLYDNVIMELSDDKKPRPEDTVVYQDVTVDRVFNDKFSVFFDGVVKIYTEYMKNTFPNNPVEFIGYKVGRRYIKVVRDTSVFCFVDTHTGNVLKAASWNAPAKHARGNIYDDDYGLKNIGPYGPAYLKKGRK